MLFHCIHCHQYRQMSHRKNNCRCRHVLNIAQTPDICRSHFFNVLSQDNSTSSYSTLTASCLENVASRTNGSHNQSQSSALILQKYKWSEMGTDVWQVVCLEKLCQCRKLVQYVTLSLFFNECSFWLLNSSILEQRVWSCWASWICHLGIPAWLARTGWKRVLPC